MWSYKIWSIEVGVMKDEKCLWYISFCQFSFELDSTFNC